MVKNMQEPFGDLAIGDLYVLATQFGFSCWDVYQKVSDTQAKVFNSDDEPFNCHKIDSVFRLEKKPFGELPDNNQFVLCPRNKPLTISLTATALYRKFGDGAGNRLGVLGKLEQIFPKDSDLVIDLGEIFSVNVMLHINLYYPRR